MLCERLNAIHCPFYVVHIHFEDVITPVLIEAYQKDCVL